MNQPPLFVAAKSEVQALEARLRLVRGGEWQAIFVDPSTAEEWTRYLLWDYHGPGPACFRRGVPTLAQALGALENATTDTEVVAATLYAVNELPEAKENLSPLVAQLEVLIGRDKTAFARKVALALAWSQAGEAFNHRNPDGKSFAEVTADYDFFKSLATRAARLKKTAEEVCGPVTRDTALFA